MDRVTSDVPSPPQPPRIKRRLQFYRLQMIAVPLIALIPILALLGVFGESRGQISVANADFNVNVEYVTRFRYKMIDSLDVTVRNVSGRRLDTVRVAFDKAYISRFSNVTFTPDVSTITDTAYVVELSGAPPGETRIVSVEVQAESYGRREGWVRVSADGAPPVEAPVATITFP